MSEDSIHPDPFETEEYARFVESMVPFCHCSEHYRPCEGVLAGGPCDNIVDDEPWERDDEEDEEP